VSTIRYDRWLPSGDDALLFADRDDYLEQVDAALELADRAGSFDLVLYNAGMDPVTDSRVSAADIATASSGWPTGPAGTTTGWCSPWPAGTPRGSVTMDQLVNLHLATVRSFA